MAKWVAVDTETDVLWTCECNDTGMMWPFTMKVRTQLVVLYE